MRSGLTSRWGLVAAGLLLVAGGVAGCGDGGGDSGADAPTTGEFCGALKEFKDDFEAVDPTKDLEGYISTLKKAAQRLEDVGTPDGMPSAAKDGFDLTIQKIEALPDTATVDDLTAIGDVSDEDQKKLDALDDYIAKACPELGEQTDSSSSPSG